MRLKTIITCRIFRSRTFVEATTRDISPNLHMLKSFGIRSSITKSIILLVERQRPLVANKESLHAYCPS